METGCRWSTSDLLLLVQTIHKCGFIEWNTVGKRLKGNPNFSLKALDQVVLVPQCEHQFNTAFSQFLTNSSSLKAHLTGTNNLQYLPTT